jgi:predicted GH43/DUF377 family glycosyl hydrolase
MLGGRRPLELVGRKTWRSQEAALVKAKASLPEFSECRDRTERTTEFSRVRGMEWVREGPVFGDQPPTPPETTRAWRPWVLDEGDGTLRMWYTASDGETSRILHAERRSSSGWTRLGVAIDAGFAGESDLYGVESACAVKTAGGYLMAYGGSDGSLTRLHFATSQDGRRWDPQGTFMQREVEDSGGATDPCLVVTGERWWLFFTGRHAEKEGSGTAILAAVSDNGASWDRVGTVLRAEHGEIGVSHPCVLDVSREFEMFYASDDGRVTTIGLATSPDGMAWDRRGTVLRPSGRGPDGAGVHTPCVTRLSDRSLRMWYAGLPLEDPGLGYRICSARFSGRIPVGM